MEDVFQKRANILKEVFGDVIYHSTSGETFIFCPNGCHATKRKLQINVKKNQGQCWVCGDSGSIFYFLKKYARKEQSARYYATISGLRYVEEKSQEIELPEGYTFILDGLYSDTALQGLDSLFSLGIGKQVIFQNKIGFTDVGRYSRRIIFPSFDRSGNLNYFVTRSVLDIERKYLNCEQSKSSIIFNEFLVNWNKPVILVEGIKAYLKHFAVPNVIPLLGSEKINENYKLLQEIIMNGCRKVYVALDADARAKSLEFSRVLYLHGVEVLMVDFGKKNQPDEITSIEFVSYLKEAQPYNEDDYFFQKVASI